MILAGYPPFVKDILDHGIMSGVDWKNIDLKLLFAGEAVSEIWKEKLLRIIGKDGGTFDQAINVYGMAESGIVAHATPVSTLLRRNLEELKKTIPNLPDADQVMGMYQYYALARYFEVTSGDSIVLTANAGLPLIRCGTRDNGGILEQEILADDSLKMVAEQNGIDLKQWQLPFVYLCGRKDLSISLYALNVYIENVKYALETSHYTSQLSGFFTMHVASTEALDQRFEITIELAKDIVPSTALAEALAQEIVAKVSLVNSEYAKLHSTIGDRAKPHVTLVPQGGIQTIPGRKHKWIKRA